MPIANPHLLGQKLCEIFGLPADKVKDINLHFPACDTAEVTVKLLVGRDEAGALVEELKRYELREKPAEPAVRESLPCREIRDITEVAAILHRSPACITPCAFHDTSEATPELRAMGESVIDSMRPLECTCENLFLGLRNCSACRRKRGEECG